MSGVLHVTQAIEKGAVTDWNDMEQVWRHTFCHELRVDPEEHPVLLTEHPLTPKPDREKMTEIMFESFRTPGLFLAVRSVLSLYATGHTTGIVLHSGCDLTSAVPVYEGFALPAAVTQSQIGGQDLTHYLAKLLRDGCPHPEVPEAAADLMKEQFCYVAHDYEKEMSAKTEEKEFELPDGRLLRVRNERFRCPESLFQPTVVWKSSPGIQHLIQSSIQKSDPELRSRMYGNIVLSGGGTLFPGLGQRLCDEVSVLAAAGMRIRVVAPPDRRDSAWIGGSLLASHSSFDQMLISKREFDDYGPNIVHRKCF